jgi:uncharacterized protein YdeI (BOF family)
MTMKLLTQPTTLYTSLMAMSFAACAGADRPHAMADEAFVTLAGTIAEVSSDEFRLDYGDGTILVEMDDWDRNDEARPLKRGDLVTVYGRIDDDFFERTTVEAGAVYVEGLKSYFYASSADEEGATFIPRIWVTPNPMPSTEMTVRGEVEAVDPEAQSFTVSVGAQTVTVETDELGYDPTDDIGFQKIETGDWVSVSGDVNHRTFQGRVIDARSVTTLVDESETEGTQS